MKNAKNHMALVLVVFVSINIFTFLIGKYVGEKKQVWESAVAFHHTEVDNCLKLGEVVNKQIKMAWSARMSMEEFENQIGKIVPVDQNNFSEKRKDATHIYTHVPSHRVFYLRFENGVLQGFGSNHSVDDIQPFLPSIEELMVALR